MRYAVSVADMTKFADKPLLPPLLLLQPVLTKEAVKCEGRRWDGDAVLIREDVDPERWQVILQLIRNGAGRRKGIEKWALRIYESKTGRGGWKRV